MQPVKPTELIQALKDFKALMITATDAEKKEIAQLIKDIISPSLSSTTYEASKDLNGG